MVSWPKYFVQIYCYLIDGNNILTYYIINLYKGKSVALNCDNYRDLKLTDQVMKVVEYVLEVKSEIDEMQFGFVPGKGTTK